MEEILFYINNEKNLKIEVVWSVDRKFLVIILNSEITCIVGDDEKKMWKRTRSSKFISVKAYFTISNHAEDLSSTKQK